MRKIRLSKNNVLLCFLSIAVILTVVLLLIIIIGRRENKVGIFDFYIYMHKLTFQGTLNYDLPVLIGGLISEIGAFKLYSLLGYATIIVTISLFCLVPNKKASLLTLASAMTVGAGTYFFPTFINIDTFSITPTIVFWISFVVLIIGISLLVIRIRNMLKDRKVNPDLKLSYVLTSNFMLFTSCLMCAWPIWNLVYVPILLLVM